MKLVIMNKTLLPNKGQGVICHMALLLLLSVSCFLSLVSSIIPWLSVDLGLAGYGWCYPTMSHQDNCIVMSHIVFNTHTQIYQSPSPEKICARLYSAPPYTYIAMVVANTAFLILRRIYPSDFFIHPLIL